MTITHHSPNINSGVRPSHLLTEVGVCGGVRVSSHQAWQTLELNIKSSTEKASAEITWGLYYYINGLSNKSKK